MTDLYHRSCHHKIYNLSCAELDALWEFAEGRCQICRTPELETKRGRLVIDHLGDYGQHMVRGLLCDRCNSLMARVDSGQVRYSGEAVGLYRYNSWCARRLDPKGPNVRYVSRSAG